jgi:leucyl-tRNA synthetase
VAVEAEGVDVKRALHKAVKKVGEYIDALHLNTPISTLMELLNTIGEKPVSKQTLEYFTLILAPYAPHLCEELWERLGHKTSVGLAAWPTYDPALVVDDVVTVVIQILGKKRATIEVSPSIADTDLHAAVLDAMKDTSYKVTAADRFITVYNPGTKVPRLVNVITKPS